MIVVFGRKDIGTGILHNKTDGGEGASGAILTNRKNSGKDSSTAKKWKITFDDGRVEIVYSLQSWAVENGYKPTNVRNLYSGNCVRQHKDIIKVEYYDENGDLVSFNREENIDSRNQRSREYYQTNIEERREYNRKWARENKDKVYNEKVKEQKRKYIEKNREKRREYQREYARKYREKHRDKLNEYQRRRYKKKSDS